MPQIGKTLFDKATLKVVDPMTLKAVMHVIDGLSNKSISENDVTGDAYEYLLNKLSASGINGQFRTPSHIIDLIVKLVDPKAGETICDPACGSGGFLISSLNHISDEYNQSEFTGLDNDLNMVKIAALNLYARGVQKSNIAHHNTITTPFAGEYAKKKFSVILANPPFSGKVQPDSIQDDLCSSFKTRSTELLFLKWIIDHLEEGGRAGVIVPNGVLFGSSNAHKTLRKILIEDQKLDGVISMPSGVFKPYAGVSTAILFLTKTNSGGTNNVWFYDMKADGYSLDDKRTPQPDKSDLADILARWKNQDGEKCRTRTDQSFLVPKSEIAENDYDLSINRYKEVEYEEVEYDPPKVILKRLAKLEGEITQGRIELEGMLG